MLVNKIISKALGLRNGFSLFLFFLNLHIILAILLRYMVNLCSLCFYRACKPAWWLCFHGKCALSLSLSLSLSSLFFFSLPILKERKGSGGGSISSTV